MRLLARTIDLVARLLDPVAKRIIDSRIDWSGHLTRDSRDPADR